MTQLQMHFTSVRPDHAHPARHPSHPRSQANLHTHLLATAVFAIRSLHAELVLYPKPGLVSLRDNGSHRDMDAALFMRSLFSLRHYFLRIACAGAQDASFSTLRQLGIEAEIDMLVATRGVNTHRGAIFSLGLLCAAAGYCHAHDLSVSAKSIRDVLIWQWGDALAMHSVAKENTSHGLRVAMQHAVGGAREEGAKAFPSIFEIALPQLHRSLASGRSTYEARIDAFFSLMAHMNDTNVYHRGGAEGAALVKDAAQQFMTAGGTAHPDWRVHALRSHRQFVNKRLSPGGAADMFAATLFVHHVTQSWSHDHDRDANG